MNKDNINWEEFGRALLWHLIVRHKNEDSGYDILLFDSPFTHNKAGDIGPWRLSSVVGPYSYKPLTWKQLALELGEYEEYLIPDGHDCKICPERKKCHAYFKDDDDQERCSWWIENMIMNKN